MTSFSATITETPVFIDGGFQVAQRVSLSDSFFLDDFPPFSPGAVAHWGVHLISTLTISSSTSRQYRGGGLVTERLKFTSPLGATGKYRVTRAENLRLRETLRTAFAMLISDGFSITDAAKVMMAVRIIERLALKHNQAARGIFRANLIQALMVHDVARFFLGGTLSDTVGLQETVDRQYRGTARLTENLGLASLLGGSLCFRVDLADGIEITQSEVLRAIYTGALEETIKLWVAYIDPGGGVTTWAINTRTSAVTEYLNYNFNSITKIGNKFYGATSDGLYELDGPHDDGVSIPTRFRTGLLQMAGSKFTTYKAIYLGLKIKDDGRDIFVRLTAGDGRQYTYAVKPNNTATTRVNTGKGLRSRYFSFELETVAADYDLDSVEFLPISSKRRI